MLVCFRHVTANDHTLGIAFCMITMSLTGTRLLQVTALGITKSNRDFSILNGMLDVRLMYRVPWHPIAPLYTSRVVRNTTATLSNHRSIITSTSACPTSKTQTMGHHGSYQYWEVIRVSRSSRMTAMTTSPPIRLPQTSTTWAILFKRHSSTCVGSCSSFVSFLQSVVCPH